MAAENGSHLWLRLPDNAHAEISAAPPIAYTKHSGRGVRHGKEPLSSSLYKGTNNCNQKVSASDMKITKSRSHLPPRQDYLCRLSPAQDASDRANVTATQTTENPAYSLRILKPLGQYGPYRRTRLCRTIALELGKNCRIPRPI